jgi:hypothetical protein
MDFLELPSRGFFLPVGSNRRCLWRASNGSACIPHKQNTSSDLNHHVTAVVRAALIVNNVAVAGAVSILAILLNGDWPTRAQDASYWLLVTSVFLLSMYFLTRR